MTGVKNVVIAFPSPRYVFGKSRINAFSKTAIAPAIVAGIVPIKASLNATKCFSDPIFVATGKIYFSIQLINPFIFSPPVSYD